MDAIMEKAPAAQLELNGKTYTINHMGTATYLRYKQALDAISPLTKDLKILGEYAEGKQSV